MAASLTAAVAAPVSAQSNLPSLTVTNVTATGATLNMSGWTHKWYYKQTAPTVGSCTEVAAGTSTADLTGLESGAVHVYRPYASSGCSLSWVAPASFATVGVVRSAVNLVVPEEGSASYTVKLATAPTHSVTVTLTVGQSDDGDITFDTDGQTAGNQSTLTFSTTTWSTAQPVRVSAANDPDKLYGTATITHTTASTDTAYNSTTFDVAVAEGDNDVCQGTTAVGGSGVSSGGLVDDCNILLAAKDTLRGTATLNWATTTAMASWDGITVINGRVDTISLFDKSLSGVIPSTIGNLTSLRYLYLSGNSLSGSIPSEMGNLSNLRSLYLSRNSLSGSIPSEMGNLSNLRSLYLGDNGFSGSIPTWLGNLSNLRYLSLPKNGFSGSIPTWLGNLTNLTYLDLFANKLSGSIPSGLKKLTKLQSISLTYNDLSGSIPTWLGNLTTLKQLGLSYIGLSGSIPSELGNLTSLQTLSLYSNGLSGSIPSELGNLTNLTTLYLFNNGLSGSIPSELGNLTSLTTLDLARNGLSGCVPSNLVEFLSTINPQRSNNMNVNLSACDGLSFSDLRVSVPEGSTATYTVRLATAPSDSVTVAVSISGDGDLTASPASLSFTTSDWDTAQTVTVSAAEDADTDNGTATIAHTATSTDSDYNGPADSVTVSEADNDPVLRASNITRNGAELSLSNHSTAWWYKQTAPSEGSCISVSAGTTSVSLSGLAAGTGHTYKAYSDSACGTELASTTFATTAAAQPPTSGPSLPATLPPITNAPPSQSSLPAEFYSGPVSGPDYCATASLGGQRTYAFDSDGDGVADACSLPGTRRDAVVTQTAADTLVSEYPQQFAVYLVAACQQISGEDWGDDEASLALDACGSGAAAAGTVNLSEPDDPDLFYSGPITGPDYCANASLGGQRTYAFDSDGDGVADVCSLPYTRREAVARQIAVDEFVEIYFYGLRYRALLAQTCDDVGNNDYGDDPDDLANDICA